MFIFLLILVFKCWTDEREPLHYCFGWSGASPTAPDNTAVPPNTTTTATTIDMRQGDIGGPLTAAVTLAGHRVPFYPSGNFAREFLFRSLHLSKFKILQSVCGLYFNINLLIWY